MSLDAIPGSRLSRSVPSCPSPIQDDRSPVPSGLGCSLLRQIQPPWQAWRNPGSAPSPRPPSPHRSRPIFPISALLGFSFCDNSGLVPSQAPTSGQSGRKSLSPRLQVLDGDRTSIRVRSRHLSFPPSAVGAGILAGIFDQARILPGF